MLFHLTDLRRILIEKDYSFICNAIAVTMKESGFPVELHVVTNQLRQQLIEKFPEEFNITHSLYSGTILNNWVNDENRVKFFEFGQERITSQGSRLRFLDYLIEKYGNHALFFSQ